MQVIVYHPILGSFVIKHRIKELNSLASGLTSCYKNLNRLGMFYDKLNYSNAFPFLQMLPKSINYKGKQ